MNAMVAFLSPQNPASSLLGRLLHRQGQVQGAGALLRFGRQVVRLAAGGGDEGGERRAQGKPRAAVFRWGWCVVLAPPSPR